MSDSERCPHPDDHFWVWAWFILALVFFAMFTWQFGLNEGWW